MFSGVTDSPGIILVDRLLEKAILQGASDIHLEPCEQTLRVRFRIDGLLYDEPIIEQSSMAQVLSRIKVLARMDIAERRIPQDGKFCSVLNGKTIDLRISTFPAVYGEKIVIRILDRFDHLLDLEHLGLSAQMLDYLKKLVNRSQGFFLVTGPTGSGKTTTLYSCISLLRSSEINIVTLEDPIEYSIPGITQGQVYPEIGFSFEKGIRALLRQDPDIIMVGEIRDTQTASVAIQAALTGHLVLSTLHTNDAPSTVLRLLDMGIEPFLLNASLTAILAQRLARKLCEFCKVEETSISQEHEFITSYKLPISRHFKSSGCASCLHLGYKGRVGIFQLLVITEQLRRSLTSKPSIDDIHAQARDDGMVSLLDDAVLKVNQGTISLHELARLFL